MEQEFHRRRGVVLADEHGRVVGVVGERLLVGHLLGGAVEAVDRRLVVGAVHPFVGGSELELGDLGRRPDSVERGEQRCGVDAVADRVVGHGHLFGLPVGLLGGLL